MIWHHSDPCILAQLTGFIVANMIWKEVLYQSFTDDVDGLDCVLKTANEAHTYHVAGGEVIYIGPGELHGPKAKIRAAAPINTNYFSNSTVKYVLGIYST
jgi:hypothetical protein